MNKKQVDNTVDRLFREAEKVPPEFSLEGKTSLSPELRKKLKDAGVISARGLEGIKDPQVIEAMLDKIKSWRPGKKDIDIEK